MTTPTYLIDKLAQVGITSRTQLTKENYLVVFAWLKDKFVSLNYNALYDLYSVVHNLPLNRLDSQQKAGIKQSFKQILPLYLPLSSNDITQFLSIAVKNGQSADQINEIPVGACIVYNGNVISSAYNQVNTKQNITLHAEIVALTEASNIVGSVRLSECDLYVTIEPCLMCSGAIINSRIKRVIFGSIEPKTGAIVSQYRVFENKSCNHHTQVIGPIDNTKYAADLKNFLKNKR